MPIDPKAPSVATAVMIFQRDRMVELRQSKMQTRLLGGEFLEMTYRTTERPPVGVQTVGLHAHW
jgi:hypothetical protein